MADREKRHAAQYRVVQKHFGDNVATGNLSGLQSWHEDYQAADKFLTLESDIVQSVKSDKLDAHTIEKCITELANGTQVDERFCADCQNLFDDWPDLSDPNVKDPSTGLIWPGSGADWKHTVARSLQTLVMEAAAQQGCEFCAFLLQMLRDAEALVTFRKLELRLLALGDAEMASLSVQNWGTNSSQLLWINLPGKVCDHCNSSMAQVTGFESAALESSADTYTQQGELLKIARNWVSNCAENHKDCNGSHRHRDKLPTRLISVNEEVPRLVLTAGLETNDRPRYSTLSHCWGTEPFLQLTEQNLDTFVEHIPLSLLPQTFKDAIQITRELGLSYIWIDSLCIKQSDTADWVREAGSMSFVYGNSFVNIAASSSPSVHGGCFVRPKSLVDGVRAVVKIHPSSSTLVREFRSREVYDLNTTKSHLATRAWALQERILPPRTIHFGHRGAFWECRAETANEFLPSGFPKQLGRGIVNERIRIGHFASWWSDVVALYSAANMTYPSDKLPALSGIARRNHDERGGAYVAGMWLDEDMLVQLCWRAIEPRVRPVQRAPSWAWTSVDGQVRYQVRQEGIMETNYGRVLDAKMDLLGTDPLGQVRGGELRLACQGILEATRVGPTTLAMGETNYPFRPDYVVPEPTSFQREKVYLLPLVAGRTGMAVYRKDDYNERVQEIRVDGLVLRMEEMGSKASFERVGMFRYFKDQVHDHDDGKEERFESFVAEFEREALQVVVRLALENFEKTDLFIISLV
ncbi:hypothetical protein HBI13_013140 [Parastagonospora nodorum]|nr:hypothetical protein HBI10_085020 [Parastagonospora nodorum]KAH4031594.1 hypothetical protein HBI13_013140 [Parastagonospora nodorum]KAH4040040.1 hypothetical protein HBI09_040010 [Parastagonospora nodorum]KAH4108362.1 hypothetical protein HBH46_048000 [Parastagonospora nodorum]KAH4243660.1 hypothetical protein HBI05_086560 [Parastagonospora nodorum]